MTFRVRFQPAAVEDLDAAYRYAAQHAPATAGRWLSRFHEALETLGSHPERCALAPENVKTRREIRQYLFGRRPNVFRAIFTIEGDTVWILRIRRAAQDALRVDEIDQ